LTRTGIILLFLICAALYACHVNPEKKKYELVHRKVFMLSAAVDSSKLKKPPINKDTSYIEYIFKGYDLVDIKSLDSTIRVELRYADTNNFLRSNIYDGLRRAYFTCDAALKLCAAQHYLKEIDSSLSLVILDASRPLHIQQLMWDSLAMDPVQKLNYLSNPEVTSLHNYGCAVDVTIYNSRTNEYLDMGTEFDAFEKMSQPFYEIGFLRGGQLSQGSYLNRMLLRKVMIRAGFNPITSEWWHFSLCTKQEAARRYELIR
jgi:zinc D-Ala-D-Ala dipeptidase